MYKFFVLVVILCVMAGAGVSGQLQGELNFGTLLRCDQGSLYVYVYFRNMLRMTIPAHMTYKKACTWGYLQTHGQNDYMGNYKLFEGVISSLIPQENLQAKKIQPLAYIAINGSNATSTTRLLTKTLMRSEIIKKITKLVSSMLQYGCMVDKECASDRSNSLYATDEGLKNITDCVAQNVVSKTMQRWKANNVRTVNPRESSWRSAYRAMCDLRVNTLFRVNNRRHPCVNVVQTMLALDVAEMFITTYYYDLGKIVDMPYCGEGHEWYPKNRTIEWANQQTPSNAQEAAKDFTAFYYKIEPPSVYVTGVYNYFVAMYNACIFDRNGLDTYVIDGPGKDSILGKPILSRMAVLASRLVVLLENFPMFSNKTHQGVGNPVRVNPKQMLNGLYVIKIHGEVFIKYKDGYGYEQSEYTGDNFDYGCVLMTKRFEEEGKFDFAVAEAGCEAHKQFPDSPISQCMTDMLKPMRIIQMFFKELRIDPYLTGLVVPSSCEASRTMVSCNCENYYGTPCLDCNDIICGNGYF